MRGKLLGRSGRYALGHDDGTDHAGAQMAVVVCGHEVFGGAVHSCHDFCI